MPPGIPIPYDIMVSLIEIFSSPHVVGWVVVSMELSVVVAVVVPAAGTVAPVDGVAVLVELSVVVVPAAG
jgi:hypothetical protein